MILILELIQFFWAPETAIQKSEVTNINDGAFFAEIV